MQGRLTRYLDDGAVPLDNNKAEKRIRLWTLGRSNWLIAGSLRSRKREAAIMSLIQSARMNGHDPHAYLKNVLTRLPTQQASEITELCRKLGGLVLELCFPQRWCAQHHETCRGFSDDTTRHRIFQLKSTMAHVQHQYRGGQRLHERHPSNYHPMPLFW